jgi:hypothetical protein
MAMSFRMTSFAPREATTTAEPPEPFASFMINVLFLYLNPLCVIGPARGFWCVWCVLWLKICVICVICGFLNSIWLQPWPLQAFRGS